MATRRRRKTRQGPPTADLGEVEKFATTVKQAFVDCRSDGHSMMKHDVTKDENNNWVRIKRCRSCGYKRSYVIEASGHILSAKPQYPDNYLLPKGTGRIDAEGRALLRSMTLEAEYRKKAGR